VVIVLNHSQVLANRLSHIHIINYYYRGRTYVNIRFLCDVSPNA